MVHRSRYTAGFAVTAWLLVSILAESSSALSNHRPLVASPLFSSALTATATANNASVQPERLQKKDSIDSLAADLTKVLKDLRKDPRDKDIPPPFRDTQQLCFSRTW